MQVLTPRQRAWVFHRVVNGMDAANAASAAGYPANTRRQRGYDMQHSPKVQAAVLEMSKQLLRSEGPRSIATLIAIRDDAEASPRDRIKCAELILNRSGLHAQTEHHETITHQLSEAEQDRRILAAAAELGLSPAEAQKMLISPQDFTKNAAGVFELDTPPPEPSPQQHRNNETKRRRRGMTPEQIAEDKERVMAERGEALRQQRKAEYEAFQARTITDAEFEEVVPDGTPHPLADLDDVL